MCMQRGSKPVVNPETTRGVLVSRCSLCSRVSLSLSLSVREKEGLKTCCASENDSRGSRHDVKLLAETGEGTCSSSRVKDLGCRAKSSRFRV